MAGFPYLASIDRLPPSSGFGISGFSGAGAQDGVYEPAKIFTQIPAPRRGNIMFRHVTICGPAHLSNNNVK